MIYLIVIFMLSFSVTLLSCLLVRSVAKLQNQLSLIHERMFSLEIELHYLTKKMENET